MANQGSLRNRKQGTQSVSTAVNKFVDDPVDDEGEMVEETDEDEHIQLTPLIERPVWLRLDVGPFALAYLGLITLDSNRDDWLLFGAVSWLTVGFAVTLSVHLSVVLWTQWSVGMKADVGYSSREKSIATKEEMNNWTHCLVEHDDHAGIVPLRVEDEVASVTFQDQVFRLCVSPPDVDEALWKKSSVANGEPRPSKFQPLRYPVHLQLHFYSTWQGHKDPQSCALASQTYGPNSTALQLPAFVELLGEQVVAPFFLFQIFCVVLWSLDEYWYYALFTLFALLMFESTVAYNRLKSLERLHDISHKNRNQRVWVRRGMAWMSIFVQELVPGDWISLSGSHVAVPADILLLHGTAVCDEALLTGESVPQLKQPLDTADAKALLDLQQHKESVMFGGTELLVGTNDDTDKQQPPDKGVTGIVLRTGFETAQGNLLRTMAHSSKTADGVHTKDTFVFILMLMCCAVAAAGYVLHEGWYDERRNRFRLLLHVVIIVTSVVPPELPMELSLAVTNSVADLMKRCQVYCTEYFRIPWAGEVTVCCFDKTGTLTSDLMILKGVRLFDEAVEDEENALVQPADGDIPWTTLRIMAACHSLSMAAVGGGSKRSKGIQVVGDPLEQAVLGGTGFCLVGNNIVAPVPDSAAIDAKKVLTILHRFAFSSKLKRMTTLVSEEGGQGTLWALSKGAPETIKELLDSDSIPPDFDDAAFHHMSRGRRVLAMAYRKVGTTRDLQAVKDEGRDRVEREFTFAGFLVLDCPLKPESKPVMTELKKSGHAVVMITGDALLTAAEVARQVGIMKRGGKQVTYIIQKRASEPANAGDPFSFFECVPLGASAEGRKALLLSRLQLGHLRSMKERGEASFCISGQTLAELALKAAEGTAAASQRTHIDEKTQLLRPDSQAALSALVMLISVFARHAPHQKEAVLAAFNRAGAQTLMCGDGTNDVGALKRAHVGISIISAPNVESKQREASAQISRAKAEQKPPGAKKKSKKRVTTLEESLRQLREAQDELDQVELGDASVAAPFTSRAVSIRCCKDVIQQGRCTLVTMLQIYKILGINCLVNALVLSRLFLYGVKQGDRQLTILGIAVAALFFFVTRAEPLSTLSPIRPSATVLCTQALVSITGQFLIHLCTILLATEAALAFVDPYDPSLVPDGPFNPNVLNSSTFLLTCLSTINTFAVNYRGRPFMKDLHENKLFYRSLQVCYAVLFTCSLEVFPPLNDLLQLTALPTVAAFDLAKQGAVFDLIRAIDFPVFFSGLMVLNTVSSIAFERLILRVFEN